MKIIIYMTIAIITATVGISALNNFLSTNVSYHEVVTPVDREVEQAASKAPQRAVVSSVQAKLKL